MVDSKQPLQLDGFAIMGASPFDKITPHPPPTAPRIKHLLGKALMEPETLSPEEVQEMAASIVYHLLSQREAIRP